MTDSKPLTGGGLLFNVLEQHGVRHVFGYPGGAIMPIYDALYDSNVKHFLCRHEQGAAFSAVGYSRASGKIGVCMATSGPGATNLITGTHASIDAPSVTTTTPHEIVFHCMFLDSGSATDPGKPSGTERVDDEFGAANDGGARLTVIEEVYPTAGATGAKTFTHASNESNGFTFSVRDAAAAPSFNPAWAINSNQVIG